MPLPTKHRLRTSYFTTDQTTCYLEQTSSSPPAGLLLIASRGGATPPLYLIVPHRRCHILLLRVHHIRYSIRYSFCVVSFLIRIHPNAVTNLVTASRRPSVRNGVPTSMNYVQKSVCCMDERVVIEILRDNNTFVFETAQTSGAVNRAARPY